MITALVLGLAIQTETAAAAEGLPAAQPSAIWPGEQKSPFRWLLNAPPEKRPFMVVWSSSWGYEVALRSAADMSQPVSQRGYFVAMRQTEHGLEEADSRSCGFKQSMDDLRGLKAPELVVPGTWPLQWLANPVIAHSNSSITVFGARQANGDPADVTWASPGGEVAPWVQRLYERTRDCWKPMT